MDTRLPDRDKQAVYMRAYAERNHDRWLAMVRASHERRREDINLRKRAWRAAGCPRPLCAVCRQPVATSGTRGRPPKYCAEHRQHPVVRSA